MCTYFCFPRIHVQSEFHYVWSRGLLRKSINYKPSKHFRQNFNMRRYSAPWTLPVFQISYKIKKSKQEWKIQSFELGYFKAAILFNIPVKARWKKRRGRKSMLDHINVPQLKMQITQVLWNIFYTSNIILIL